MPSLAAARFVSGSHIHRSARALVAAFARWHECESHTAVLLRRSLRFVTHFHEQCAIAAGEVTIVTECIIGAIGISAIGEVVDAKDRSPILGRTPAHTQIE